MLDEGGLYPGNWKWLSGGISDGSGTAYTEVAYLAKPIKERTIGEINDWRHDKTEKDSRDVSFRRYKEALQRLTTALLAD